MAVDKDLVLLGGGHAHIAVLKSFGMRPVEGLRLVLVTREVQAPYSGMLPGYVAGHYSYDEVHIDLRRLARFSGAELHHAEAIGLDLEKRRVLLKDRPPLRYDLLSIDVGIRPRAGVPGCERAIAVKPIDGFAARWERLLAKARAADRLRIVLVGGGAAGVELSLAMQHRLKREMPDPSRLSIAIVSAGEILATHGAAVRRAFSRVLRERGIDVHGGRPVIAVEPEGVRTAGGMIPADEILWTTHASPPEWLAGTGLACDEEGFVRVDETLRSPSHANVFAAGDVASVDGHPRPKAGVFAVRQGPPLAENLRRELEGDALVRFVPQKKILALVSTGDRAAIASKWPGIAPRGEWVWKWKDQLDRRFMRKYSELSMNGAKPMASDATHEAMRCAGCGAKVGGGILTRVLERIGTEKRDDVILGLDAPDDAAVLAPSTRAQVQTIDFFRAIVDDPFIFGAIAANHALGDVWAMGATARAALALATIPHGPERRVEEVLFQMLSGSARVLKEAGCVLVGGHTGEGSELALGFSVTGEMDGAPLRKSGAKPGDTIVLTKAIGTGILFAAEMRLLAKARWIEAAIDSMLVSSKAAARALATHGATACTDVTGFGLAGHLLEIARASKVDVEIEPASVPRLDGVDELSRAGVRSSLFPQNERVRDAIDGQGPDFLFDPQTAGGLVATVPPASLAACLSALRAAGVTAVEIGAIRSPSENPRLSIREP